MQAGVGTQLLSLKTSDSVLLLQRFAALVLIGRDTFLFLGRRPRHKQTGQLSKRGERCAPTARRGLRAVPVRLRTVRTSTPTG